MGIERYIMVVIVGAGPAGTVLSHQLENYVRFPL